MPDTTATTQPDATRGQASNTDDGRQQPLDCSPNYRSRNWREEQARASATHSRLVQQLVTSVAECKQSYDMHAARWNADTAASLARSIKTLEGIWTDEKDTRSEMQERSKQNNQVVSRSTQRKRNRAERNSTVTRKLVDAMCSEVKDREVESLWNNWVGLKPSPKGNPSAKAEAASSLSPATLPGIQSDHTSPDTVKHSPDTQAAGTGSDTPSIITATASRPSEQAPQTSSEQASSTDWQREQAKEGDAYGVKVQTMNSLVDEAERLYWRAVEDGEDVYELMAKTREKFSEVTAEAEALRESMDSRYAANMGKDEQLSGAVARQDRRSRLLKANEEIFSAFGRGVGAGVEQRDISELRTTREAILKEIQSRSSKWRKKQAKAQNPV